MLKITQEQLDMMGAYKLPEFYQQVIDYIKTEFPDFYAEQEDDLTPWVTQNYQKAKSYNIDSIKNHIKYTNYCCIFGQDFDEKYLFAKQILSSGQNTNVKMAELKNAFLQELN